MIVLHFCTLVLSLPIG